MSTITSHDHAAWRAQLLKSLRQMRAAADHAAVDAEFYIALGWISAGHCLGAISIGASDRLHELAFNASEHRTAELNQKTKARRIASAQERAA